MFSAPDKSRFEQDPLQSKLLMLSITTLWTSISKSQSMILEAIVYDWTP